MLSRSSVFLVFILQIFYLITSTEQQSTKPDTNATANGSSSPGLSHTASLFYGLLATTITNMAALMGFVFTSAHKCACYPTLISFMVAVAVGSLFSTAILVLVPEAFGLVGNPEFAIDYTPTAVTVCVGAFIFYLLEYFLRRIRSCIEYFSGRHDSHGNTTASCELRAAGSGDLEVVPPSSVAILNGGVDGHGHIPSKNTTSHDHYSVRSLKSVEDPIRLCGPNTCQRITRLDPVVWMIVIGDGMHNLMDGLSIGAGFATNWQTGLTLSLAILCEEFPHELGDFAILLRSGLSVGMALLFNFASACTAYFGFFLGFYLGDVGNVSLYIFALTAGFFLYIALADMSPELRKSEEERMVTGGNSTRLFFIHALGLVVGFGSILAVKIFSDNFEL